MKPVTREWINKAEKDFESARQGLRLRRHTNHDLTCFLAQQCIEKYLKARLQEASIRFDRTHDLIRLLDQAIPVEPLWSVYRNAMGPLSAYATVFRYPGRTATPSEARAAVGHALAMRIVIRQALGLSANKKKPSRQSSITSRKKKKKKRK